MPRRTEKRAVTVAHLKSHGIHPDLFDGVDYEVSGLHSRHPYERDSPGSGFNIGWKLVNLYLTHFLAWKTCLYLPEESFVFFEDDVRFDYDWKEPFSDAVQYLPNDWDILYVGSCCAENQHSKHQIHGRLWEVWCALCCHAYAVKKSALPVLISACERIFAPVDIAIITETKPMRRFAILPRVASQFETVIPP